MRFRCLAFFSLLFLLVCAMEIGDTPGFHTPAFAQQPPVTTKKSSGRASYKTLTVTVVNTDGRSAILQAEGVEAPIPATITEKTKFHRLIARSQKQGFTVGEKLVLRMGFYPDGRVVVTDFYDPEIYAEVQRLRKETILGTVDRPLPAGTTSGYLAVRTEEDSVIEYRVTDNTIFYKDNTRVAPQVYVQDTSVVVKPRALPTGGFMAQIVAESETAVDIAYKDTLSLWNGVAERVDPTNFYLMLKRSDGVTRKVIFPRNLTLTDEKTRKVSADRKLYALSEIQGKPIIVRLVRSEKPGENGTRTAVEITVGTDNLLKTPTESTNETEKTAGKP
jgi:hypothetical protein